MKSLFIAVTLAAVATLAAGFTSCSSTGTVCEGDHCVCAAAGGCSHDCTPGGEACEVQCQPGAPCDVGCAAGEHCHVECSGASSCDVDCGSSPECHVTCPATGCTVHNCVGAACQITCGVSALPSHSGSTATCP
jgi:hypothetical protein